MCPLGRELFDDYEGQIVAELDAEAAQIESVRALLPRSEAKIQRLLARVWGTGASLDTKA